MEHWIKGRGLIFISPNEILVIRHLKLYKIHTKTGNAELICRLPTSKSKRLLSRSRMMTRLFRLEPKCISHLSGGRYIFCIFSKLWCVDVDSKSIKQIFELRKGFSVLNFCSYKGKLYFGEYGTNKNLEGIGIYEINPSLEVSQVYSFMPGDIRHIHNIINDSIHQRFIILTGDNERKSGVYFSDYTFSAVIPFAIGEQKYRAVMAFPLEKGILYATDSVEEANSINLLSYDGTVKKILDINGSCIYGLETPDSYLFSTTVEPREGNSKKDLFTYKLGAGIKTRDVHIIQVTKGNLSAKILKTFRKDIFPMNLFQYGRMTFPGHQSKSNEIWVYNIGCKGVDGRTIKIK